MDASYLLQRQLVLPVIIPFGLLVACPQLHARNLTVSAASSLSGVLPALAAGWTREYPEEKVTTNFAASSVLVQQMDNGAPVDVLITADQESMQVAARKGLVRQPVKLLAANRILLVVPSGSRCPASVQNLARAAYSRIATGNPKLVPAGRYAMEAFDLLHLTLAVQPKLVNGNSVRQVFDYVSRGEVDAGVVYQSDLTASKAAGLKNNVRSCQLLPTRTPVVYPVAISAQTPALKEASQFVRYLESPAGQAILAKYGFLASP